MKRKIAHFYKDTESPWLTLAKFSITYKELYKVIDNSSILSYKIVKWIQCKRCIICKSFKPNTHEHFYIRANTKYLYSSCKDCMKIMARNYKILNKKDIKIKQKEYSKKYYYNNKDTILESRKIFYNKYRNKISINKKKTYMRNKLRFIRNFITKLK